MIRFNEPDDKENRMIKANIYGDSIMKGTVVHDDLNAHTVMENTLQKIYSSYNVEVENRSRFGITIHMGKKILERDIKKGLSCQYALIEFGGNDCNYRWEDISKDPEAKHEHLTPFEEFKKSYSSIINTLKEKGIKPIGMSLPPLDAEKYFKFLINRGNDMKNMMKWLGDVSMLYRCHERYSNAVTKIAKAADILFVDVREYFLDSHDFKKLMCIDGIHPNEEGHKLLHHAFDEYLSTKLLTV